MASQSRSEHGGWISRYFMPRAPEHHSSLRRRFGLTLLVAPTSPLTLHAAASYGVFGLIGFLAQMVVAMETRLLPMVAWFWRYARSGYQEPPPSPHVMRDRLLQAVVFAGWSIGVPALAAGLFRESAPLVSVGAWTLFVGVALGTLDNTFVVIGTMGRQSGGDRRSADQLGNALTPRA